MGKRTVFTKVRFTPVEDAIVLKLFAVHGRQWRKISQGLAEHGYFRTDHSVGNRVTSMLRAKNRQAAPVDTDRVLIYANQKLWNSKSCKEFFDGQ